MGENKSLNAMIKVSLGTATKQEKELVESLDERTFSTLYKELEEIVDSNYAIEDYYKIKHINKVEPSVIEIEDIDDEDEDEDEDLDNEDFDKDFEEYWKKNSNRFESKEDAYKHFCEKYSSKNSNYSDIFNYSDEELRKRDAILEEYNEFLSLYGDAYDDEEDAYTDFVNNYSSY